MEESAYFSVGGLFTDLVWCACAPFKMGLMPGLMQPVHVGLFDSPTVFEILHCMQNMLRKGGS